MVLVHLGRREQHGPLLGALLFGDAVEDAVLELFHHTDEDALLHQGEITRDLSIYHRVVEPVGATEVLHDGTLALALAADSREGDLQTIHLRVDVVGRLGFCLVLWNSSGIGFFFLCHNFQLLTTVFYPYGQFAANYTFLPLFICPAEMTENHR